MRRSMRINQLLLVAILLFMVSTSNGANPARRSIPSTQEIDRSVVPQIGTQPDFQMQIEPNQFLLRAGTGATPSLVFTPIYGFAGNVTLSVSVSPMPSALTISYLPASVKLNASSPGSPAYSMGINTTLATPLGLYTVTVLGASGSISHTASATIGVTDVFIQGNSAEMLYKANFTSIAYAGKSTVLNNTFEDLGYISIGVWNLTASLSFGTYNENGGLYCFQHCWFATLNPYQERTTSLTINIPANTSPGNYTLTVVISWALQPGSIYEQSAPELVAHGSVIVYSNPRAPSGLPSMNGVVTVLLAAVGGVVAAAAIMFLLLTVIERRRKDPFRGLSRSSESVQPRSLATKSCPYCGQTVPAGEFCPECGSQLYRPPSPQSPPTRTAENTLNPTDSFFQSAVPKWTCSDTHK